MSIALEALRSSYAENKTTLLEAAQFLREFEFSKSEAIEYLQEIVHRDQAECEYHIEGYREQYRLYLKFLGVGFAILPLSLVIFYFFVLNKIAHKDLFYMFSIILAGIPLSGILIGSGGLIENKLHILKWRKLKNKPEISLSEIHSVCDSVFS